MVKRKPQYVKIKEYIIQNIEDEKYNENEQIESCLLYTSRCV